MPDSKIEKTSPPSASQERRTRSGRPPTGTAHQPAQQTVVNEGPANTGESSPPKDGRKRLGVLSKNLNLILGIIAGLATAAALAVGAIWMPLESNHYDAVDREQKAEIASLSQANDTLQKSLNDSKADLKDSKAVLDAEKNKNSRLCDAVKSAITSGRYAGSQAGIRGNCPLPPFPWLIVGRPATDAHVAPVTEAIGTVDVGPLNGRTIWFGVMTPGEPGPHIQGDWPTRRGPAKITNGRWTSPGLTLGNNQDAGKQFDIVVILADQNASNKFWDYLKQGSITHKFPAMTDLPAGAEEAVRVPVFRK